MATKAKHTHRARKPRAARRPATRAHLLLAHYLPCKEGGYTAQLLGARGVVTEGETHDAARKNLLDAIQLMADVAPHQFGLPVKKMPKRGLIESVIVLLPTGSGAIS